jgi:hypothetical protein
VSINQNDFQQGWNAAIDEAVESMNKCTAIPLMTPPDHPLFQLFFILKDGVFNLKKSVKLPELK